jgi:hypothetical protein
VRFQSLRRAEIENACIHVTALVAALSNAPHLVSAADNVPKFGIPRECRSEGGSKPVQEKCAEDEAAARDQVQPLWVQFSAADKAFCVQETKGDGTPSYVELLTCLEMARDVKKTSKQVRFKPPKHGAVHYRLAEVCMRNRSELVDS